MGEEDVRAVPVIAVFGSSEDETLGPARSVGAEIASGGGILLTGGGRGHGSPAVKESAMEGAEGARRRGYLAARVGVLGREKNTVDAELGDERTQLVLAPAYGDRRNYLNACLCDVAIAFHGGDGTKSEVAFSLALGRPVVLVGERWTGEYPVLRGRTAYDAFVRAARRRVPGDTKDEVDRLITDAYARLEGDGDDLVDQLPLDLPVKDAVKLARRRAHDAGLPGRFPDLPERRGLATAYAQWVTEMDARLRGQGRYRST